MQIAEYFVCGDVVEAEGGLAVFRLRAAVGTGGFQQGERADDVGLDEFARAVYASVHMAFGGKVHHGIGPVFGEDFV